MYWTRGSAGDTPNREGQQFRIHARQSRWIGPFLALCTRVPGAAQMAPGVPADL